MVKISDFGEAKEFEEEDNLKTYKGTKNYIAPEMKAPEMKEEDQDRRYSTKVDIYSFGVLFHNLLHSERVPSVKSGEVYSMEHFKSSHHQEIKDLAFPCLQ